MQILQLKFELLYTVEPVYNGPVLSGHPLLSGQFSKSRIFANTNALITTCIKRPPLLSGCGHPLAVPCWFFFVVFTCIKRSPLTRNLKPHVTSCSFSLCLIVFKKRPIITIEMTKLMLIINRSLWLILPRCPQWAVVQNHGTQTIIILSVSNLLPSSSTWNSSLVSLFLSHVIEKESPSNVYLHGIFRP